MCFFSFPFITRNVHISRVKERVKDGWDVHRGEVWIFSEPLLLRSAFARLVQGHFNALNRLSFSLLLYNRDFSIGPSQGIEYLSFPCFSILRVSCRTISRQRIILVSIRFSTFASLIQFRLFSASQPWVFWHKASVQSDVTSSNFSTGILHSP